jgi:hypothetical protein
MRGEGKIVESIRQMFNTSVARHIKTKNRQIYELDLTAFRVPDLHGQLNLFD